MPLMGMGSVSMILRKYHPHGLDEPVIAIVGREVIKALCYVHAQVSIHLR